MIPAARDALAVAFAASAYAVCAANPYPALVTVVVALGGHFGVNHVADEHRRQMAAYRAEVWARRRREAGL